MLIPQLHKLFLQSAGVSTDSRNIFKNCLFFALRGLHFDGNKYALEALEKGAAFAIVDNTHVADHPKLIQVKDVLNTLQQLARFHRSTFEHLKVIGITGSNGKTTTKELLHSVLNRKYNVISTKGNYNNHIGVPLTLLQIKADHEIAIIEMGANHVGEIAELCELTVPNYGLITNIGQAHLDGFGSIENIIQTKTALYRSVEKNGGTIFIHQHKAELVNHLPENVEKIFYNSAENPLFAVSEARSNPFLSFQLKKEKIFTIQTQLTGAYNLDNICAAIAVGYHFEVASEAIKLALETYTPQNHRSQIQHTSKNTLIIDAYNANPSSMTSALKSFIDIDMPEKVAILGDMLELGQFEAAAHHEIIQFLTTQNLMVFFIGPIFYSLKQSYPNFKFFKTTDDATESIKKLTGKSILLKGSRGIRLENLIARL